MVRTVADVALFLDTTAGECPLDPLTFEAPQRVAFKGASPFQALTPIC